MVLVPMLLCLTVHEYAHGRAALFLGDDTAYLQGRLTLNPVAHIDLFGTLVLPILAVVTNSFFFGWAKPVPVNPLRFNRRFRGHRVSMPTGMLITAAAGPLSNVLFGFVSLLITQAMWAAGIESEGLYNLMFHLLLVNFVLAVFNLIPLPPLDGSKVLAGLLPRSLGRYIYMLEANAFVSIVLIMALLGTGALDVVMRPAIIGLLRFSDWAIGIPEPVLRLFFQ
jgi:Zn-dependent protease